MSKKVKAFSSFEDAQQWMLEQVQINDASDDPNVDNVRFAFLDDEKALEIYKQSLNEGCCGFFDQEIIVNGRKAKIGCNYGH
jgi:hypothetical protein